MTRCYARVIVIGLIIFASIEPRIALAECDASGLTSRLTFHSAGTQYKLLTDNNRYFSATTKERKAFLNEGWPTLLQIAKDNDTTVVDLLVESFETMELMVNEYQRRTNIPTVSLGLVDMSRAAFEHLETLPLNKKFHSKKIEQQVRVGVSAMRHIAVQILLFEQFVREHPSIDPFAPIDERWMIQLVDSLQNITLDFALLVMDQLIPPPVNSAPVLAPAVQPEKGPESHLSESDAPSAAVEAFLEEVAPAPREPNVPVQTRHSFSASLRGTAAPLISETAYDVPLLNRAGQIDRTISVTLSNDLVKQLRGVHAAKAERLLKTLLGPQTSKSGMKKLDDGAIELKAVMRGHWRILGCMDGAHVRLIDLREMPESKAGYSRVIPAHFCAQASPKTTENHRR